MCMAQRCAQKSISNSRSHFPKLCHPPSPWCTSQSSSQKPGARHPALLCTFWDGTLAWDQTAGGERDTSHSGAPLLRGFSVCRFPQGGRTTGREGGTVAPPTVSPGAQTGGLSTLAAGTQLQVSDSLKPAGGGGMLEEEQTRACATKSWSLSACHHLPVRVL